MASWCEELTHWKRYRCWERLKAGGAGDNRGWDVWMASPIQWTWIWVRSGSWWWTGKPGVLQFMRSQSRTQLEWLNWTSITIYYLFIIGCVRSQLWHTGSTPEHAGPVVVMHGLSCFTACGILVPRPGVELSSPALEGRFFFCCCYAGSSLLHVGFI